VRLAESNKMCFEAVVAAAAEDVSLGGAISLNAEEDMLVNGSHLVWVLRKSCYLGKVL
jgi:hypothetical protein